MKIIAIAGRQIYDSRGLPTLACDVYLENGAIITSSVPSGTSRGVHEALELRDGGSVLYGLEVTHAIDMISCAIEPIFLGLEPNAVRMDLELLTIDGTINKSKLGANTMLAVSQALYRAQAYVEGIELYELIASVCDHKTVSIPVPLVNVINGGAHAANNLAIQEFLIAVDGTTEFSSAMRSIAIVYQELKKLLLEHNRGTYLGDEGGFAPCFTTETEPLDYIMEAVRRAHLPVDQRVVLGLDVAASQLFNETSYEYDLGRLGSLSSEQLIEWYAQLVERYPLYVIEDGLAQDDWEGWEILGNELGQIVHIAGDDIFATNPERIARGIERHVADAAVIKPNQIGTVTEALQAIKLCHQHGMKTIVSHRSGDTEDSFIVDLAVGAQASHVKLGGCSRGERTGKYNRLLAIEAHLLGLQDSF